jgi:hypothetical protein
MAQTVVRCIRLQALSGLRAFSFAAPCRRGAFRLNPRRGRA